MKLQNYLFYLIVAIAFTTFYSCSDQTSETILKEYSGISGDFNPIENGTILKVSISDTTTWFDESNNIINSQKNLNKEEIIETGIPQEISGNHYIPVYNLEGLNFYYNFKNEGIYLYDIDCNNESLILPASFSIGTTWQFNNSLPVKLTVIDYFETYTDPNNIAHKDVIKVSFSLDKDNLGSNWSCPDSSYHNTKKLKVDGHFLLEKGKGIISLTINNYDEVFISVKEYTNEQKYNHIKKSGIMFFEK